MTPIGPAEGAEGTEGAAASSSPSCVVLGDLLGSGAFGRVYAGKTFKTLQGLISACSLRIGSGLPSAVQCLCLAWLKQPASCEVV